MFNFIKKYITMFLVLLFLMGYGISYADVPEEYVAVTIGISTHTGEVSAPKLLDGSYDAISKKEDTGYIVTYTLNSLTKKECTKLVKETVNSIKSRNSKIVKTDSRYNSSKASIYETAYVVDEVDRYAEVYLCISIDTWNEIQPQKKNSSATTIKYVGLEYRNKDSDSFFSVMKKCGISNYDFFHINTPKTLFVCDKYTADNPVPFKTYDEIIKGRYKNQ